MILPTILDRIQQQQGQATVVQIGAFTGATDNDPLFTYLKQKCADENYDCTVRAILVEPVNRFFRKLVLNYFDCTKAITLENVAIAEAQGIRKFFVVRNTPTQRPRDIPHWTSQLGSLLPNRVTELWDYYEKDLTIKQFLLENTIEERVITITYKQLLDKNAINKVDLLQIDAEGYDFELLKTIKLDENPPAAINYESVLLKDTEQECRDYLHSYGYVTCRHGQDTLAIRQESMWLVAGLY